MAKDNTPTPVQRTSAGLRDAIFDELDALRRGESNPTRANAVAKLASSIVETVSMEVQVERHRRAMAGVSRDHRADADVTSAGESMRLGSR